MTDSLSRCKEILPLPALWVRLGIAGEPKRQCKSPFREDAKNSFSVFEKGGMWFWRDHGTDQSGDEVDFIVVARDLSKGEAIALYHELAGVPKARQGAVQPDREKSSTEKPRKALPAKRTDFKPDWSRLGEIVSVYDYHSAGGEVLHQTFRFNPKTFRQRRRPLPSETAADDGWVYTLDGLETVIYRLPEVIACPVTQPIFFVEGEKDADALAVFGHLATTVPMGAGKWRDSYTEAFRGKWVVVIGDNDQPGRDHVAKVCAKLNGIAARLGAINIVDKWPECPEKGDLYDWLDSREDGLDIITGTLWAWAQEARTPAELLFAGCFGIGERGARIVYQDVMAEVLVKEHELRFAGETWWQWRKTVWSQLEVQSEAGRCVIEAVNTQPMWRPAITTNLVNSIEGLMQRRSAMHPDRFNQHDGNLINCANGMLHVRDRVLHPHEPRFLSTVQIPWNYNPAAKCERWQAWIDEMLPEQDVRDLVQEIFGYSLTNTVNYHKFFFFFGDGGTGKSTAVQVLTRLVGAANTVAVRLQDLDNPFLRAQLVGKRLYLAKELSRDSYKHIDLVKAIVSGDPIHVEKKHKDGYTYCPQGRFIMESNVRPATSDTTDGFFRRLCQVSFNNKIPEAKKDYSLGDKFTPEMDGILLWALDGLARLVERGRFAETRDSAEAAELIAMHRASVKAFVTTCTQDVGDPEQMLTAQALFEEYKTWCEWEHVRAYYEDVDSFSRELLSRFPSLRERRKRVRAGTDRFMAYTGLAWREWRGEPLD